MSTSLIYLRNLVSSSTYFF